MSSGKRLCYKLPGNEEQSEEQETPAYLYNFVMDFYDNEEIVIKQEEMLSKTVEGKEIKRDMYSRFYFE